MTQYILPLDKFSKEDIAIVGGKAANLGELIQNGFPVPSGIVVTTEAYTLFIKRNDLRTVIDQSLKIIDYSQPNSLEEASARIQAAIRHGNLPNELIRSIEDEKVLLDSSIAIRSSGTAEDLPTASFAGQYESYLHIRGMDNIIRFIKDCYASLWSTRTIVYRYQNNIPHEDVRIAVILQHMVSASSSGVLFTANPISLDQNESLVESVFGLGEALVSGQVNPDQFVVKNLGEEKFEILTREISSKELKIVEGEQGVTKVLLSDDEQLKSSILDDQVLKIVKMGFAVQEHYKCPQDIEWAFDKSDKNLYLTQTRPITSILKSPEKSDDVWTRGYADDYWNDPTTELFYDLLGTQLTLIVNIELNSIMGYPEICDTFLRLYHGHVYFNLEVLKYKVEYEIPTFLRNEDLLNYFPEGKGRFGKETMRKQPFQLGKRIISEIRIMLHDNSNGSILNTASSYEKWTHKVFWPFCKNFDNNLARISADNEISQLLQLGDEMEHTMAGHYRMVRYGIPVHNIGMNLMVQYLLTRFIGKSLAQALYPVLISGLEHKVSETNKRIQKLAVMIRNNQTLKDLILTRESPNFYNSLTKLSDKDCKLFKNEFDLFLEDFGDRGFTREMYYPRWGEAPFYVVDILKSLVTDYNKDTIEQEEKNTEYKNKIDNFVAFRIRSSRFGFIKYKLFTTILSLARTYIIFRENQRFNLDKWITRVRLLYLEIGERFCKKGILKEKEDIFFLHKSEIRKLARRSFSTGEQHKISVLVKKRREIFLKYEFTIPPKFIQGKREFDDPVLTTKGDNIFKGIPASQGIISAPARVLIDISQISEVKAGEILIVPKTDPGWTPIFAKIGGLITETGGILSHGAVVSREYGIPAVTNIFNACKILKTGDIIKINGTNGFVEIQRKEMS